MDEIVQNRLERGFILEEDLDFEIPLYEDLVREKPDLVAALIPLGDAYTKKGLYEKGLEIDLRLAVLRPKDEVVHYNLACDYSRLKNFALAFKHLKRAITLGYDDFEYMNEDPDLDNVRQDPRFQRLVGKFLKK